MVNQSNLIEDVVLPNNANNSADDVNKVFENLCSFFDIREKECDFFELQLHQSDSNKIPDKVQNTMQVNSIRERIKQKQLEKISSKRTKQLKPPSSLQCSLCPMAYTSKKLFKLHMYLHQIQSKPNFQKADEESDGYKCNFCEAHCVSKYKLGDHLIAHEEPFKECGTVCPNAFVLGIHLAEHDCKERLCCPYCTYKGSHAPHLKTHLLTRHLKPEISNYSSKVHLDEHTSVHCEKMDPYICSVRKKTFILKTSLRLLREHQINNHLPLIDVDIPSYHCSICKETSNTVEAFNKHTAEKHSNNNVPKNSERFICGVWVKISRKDNLGSYTRKSTTTV